MKTIWKFPLEITFEQYITVPGRPEFLCCQMQLGRLMLWAIVSDGDPQIMNDRTVFLCGTGHPMPTVSVQYIGTVQEAGGVLIWHVFVETA